jgi:hypothetical protein
MAQKYIKIMQGGYGRPVKTGYKVLSKFTMTSSEEFNRKVFEMLDTVKQNGETIQVSISQVNCC